MCSRSSPASSSSPLSRCRASRRGRGSASPSGSAGTLRGSSLNHQAQSQRSRHVRNKFKVAGALAAAAVLALTGCSGTGGGGNSGGGDDGTFKVIAFTSGNQTPVGAWWVKAVTAKAEELGWDLKMIQGDFDFQKMNPAVESAIGQGADVILDG